MLTKIKNFVKQNLSWLTFGLCALILVVNLRQCAAHNKGPRKAPGEIRHVAP